ncbi:MAG: hypothetical protein WBV82_22975 [Myxococcaceae bacterium]
MAKAESYNDLIFQLGDLARDRLVNKPTCPQAMQRVFRAEEALVVRQEELAALEQQMNDEDVAWQAYLEEVADERAQREGMVKRFKKAVDAIEGRVKELRKKVSTRRADLRYHAGILKNEERRLADLEMTTHDPSKLDLARQNLKKLRLAHLRGQRELEELQTDLDKVLTPRPGQPGAEGILAHKRLLELEDEVAGRRQAFDPLMSDLDQSIAEKEEEVRAAEDYLDQALFLLGEECYANRIADPELAVLYPRIDRAN